MNKKLYCSPDKKLCGLCGGLADYINFDPTLVRAIVAVIALCTAVVPALIIYFIVALIVPKAPDNYYQLYNNTSKRITKGHDKKIAGVCSGVAEYFNCDATIVRVIFLLICLWFGSGLLAYIACAIIFPEPVDNYYYQQNGQYGYNQSYGGQYQQPENNQNYNAQNYQQDEKHNTDNNESNPENN